MLPRSAEKFPIAGEICAVVNGPVSAKTLSLNEMIIWRGEFVIRAILHCSAIVFDDSARTECDCALINNEAFTLAEPGLRSLSNNFPYSTHLLQLSSARPNSECFIQIPNYIQFSSIYYFVPLPPSSCAAASLMLYDKWNKRFRSRRKVLRVVDIKKGSEEFPFYYRAQAEPNLRASRSRISMLFWFFSAQRLQKIAEGIFGKSQKATTRAAQDIPRLRASAVNGSQRNRIIPNGNRPLISLDSICSQSTDFQSNPRLRFPL